MIFEGFMYFILFLDGLYKYLYFVFYKFFITESVCF